MTEQLPEADQSSFAPVQAAGELVVPLSVELVVPKNETTQQPAPSRGEVDAIRITNDRISYIQVYVWGDAVQGRKGEYSFYHVSPHVSWKHSRPQHEEWTAQKQEARTAGSAKMPQPVHRMNLDAQDVTMLAGFFNEGLIEVPEDLPRTKETLPGFLARVMKERGEKG